ncbi:HipA domain-containing protein [Methylobacterium oryzae]|uniref:Protein of unassigned function n=1 Tax=Methylobacterium oryzae CBMB20 TaxID=693986 RepID=A0A089NX52_9HYPH|nr:HipA domain-containing protein [Methylobacterium oryzae]AIQ91155.1 protein of unassigned function [Methylobacterium oryzae CBMB20]
MYTVFDLAGLSSDRPEMLGTKEKFWFKPIEDGGEPGRFHLFKIGRPGTGENWAEKIACEIAKRIGMPCADYELAMHEGKQGIISPLFIPEDANLVTANYLIARVVNGYDGEKRFNQFEYRLHVVLNLLHRSAIKRPMECGAQFGNFTSVEMFIGYLFFDALIGNTDRHHENWGVVLHGDPISFYLAPTYDHASSLGRNETDAKRDLRLNTRDQRATVEAYASKARSAFFGPEGTTKPLLHREVIAYINRNNPTIARFWSAAVCGVSDGEIMEMFNKIDPSFISKLAVDFAMRVLQYNRNMIREICDAS